MYGFLTEKFLLKEIKIPDVFLEKENPSDGYNRPVPHFGGWGTSLIS